VRRALVIGIDKYPNFPLSGCENDATAVASVLETNGDGSPNFGVRLLTSDSRKVTTEAMSAAIEKLFEGDADTVLLFFAGHGVINPNTNAGYLVSQDGTKPTWGVSITDILAQANGSYPKIKSTVIILDSCQSGYAGEVQSIKDPTISALGTGVTILTACHRSGTAAEFDGHGLFTGLLLDGLRGTSADVCGRITPASVYSLIDQSLGEWEQRPIYKANVQNFVTLREVAPKISLEVLRRLPSYFRDPSDVYPLDPSYEEDRSNVPHLAHIPVNPDHVRILKELQACNRHGLVVPHNAEHMYYAAIHSTGCKLTALGAHYRKLAAEKRI
jgi:Caspase domain